MRQSPVRLRTARVILIYAVAVILVGAFLAPWAFTEVHAHWPLIPFRRVFDRVLLIIALLGLVPMLWAVGIKSAGDLGYIRRVAWGWHVLGGFASGVVSLGLCAVFLRQFTGWKTNYAANLASAVAVGVIEETFFSGGDFWSLSPQLVAWFGGDREQRDLCGPAFLQTDRAAGSQLADGFYAFRVDLSEFWGAGELDRSGNAIPGRRRVGSRV